jgi:hypothetical protein
MRARSVSAKRPVGWVDGAAPFVIAVFVIGTVAAPILMQFSGLAERQTLMREAQQAEANRWDAAFCEKYGMAQGSERHSTCLNDLLDLRRQEKARLDEQAQGIL